MKKIFFAGIIFISLLLSSCTTYQYSARQANIERQDITTMPTVVDVTADYTKRVEVVSNWHRTKEDAINECKYIAIVSKKIDVVVDPILKIQFRKWKIWNRYQVTLTGFSGYYTNQRTIYEDIQQLKQFSREDIEKYLILHNPSVLQYMNATSDVINIYHENGQPAKSKGTKAEPAPKQEPAKDTKSQNKRK